MGRGDVRHGYASWKTIGLSSLLTRVGDPDFDADICFEPDFDQYAVLPEDELLSNLYDEELVSVPSDVQIHIRSLLTRSPGLQRLLSQDPKPEAQSP